MSSREKTFPEESFGGGLGRGNPGNPFSSPALPSLLFSCPPLPTPRQIRHYLYAQSDRLHEGGIWREKNLEGRDKETDKDGSWSLWGAVGGLSICPSVVLWEEAKADGKWQMCSMETKVRLDSRSTGMNTQFVRVNEDGIRWEGTAYQEGPIQVVTIELIETKEETLHFNQKPDEYRVVGINLRDFQPLKTVKELVISKYMKEFYVSDFLFPNLERIIIEEGAPFYAKGGQSFFEGGEASKFLSSWSI